MNYEIKKENWAKFLDDLSKRRYEWTTSVEVLSSEIGDQILTDGLPLNGITVETTGDRTSIDISVGEGTDAHQTHNIKNPTKIAFLAGEEGRSDVIDIEEENGTKTLITFIEPMGIIFGYTEVEMVATASES
ncbi:MAG TPA: DUF5335 family protein [Pyrinomonadaceae bacterium]